MSVVVIATVVPAPEQRSEVIAAFEEIIPRVHASDEGCELYALHEAEDRLVMIEKWASEDALEAHGRGSALADLMARLEDKLIGGLDVRTLQPHPAGTQQQGTT